MVQKIINTLHRQSQSSLQPMELDFTTRASSSSLGRLARYKRLTNLRLPAVMVLRSDSSTNGNLHQLPMSLQCLTLVMTLTTKKIKEKLNVGLQIYVQNAKSLRQLTILWPTHSRRDRSLDLSSLCSTCEIAFSSRYDGRPHISA